MATESSNIAKNTLVLYVRLIITVFIAFFTQRVVLKALGFEDYGLYNVVGGIIIIVGIINAGMVQASQRFFAFELGKNTKSDLKKVFKTSLTIHVLLAVIILIIAEIGGVWFLCEKMNIEQERLFAANIVYQYSLLSLLVTIFAVPFDAMIISKEDFNIFAYLSICEYVLKLVIACFIMTITDYDRLIIYASLLFSVTLLCKIITIIYCEKKYKECIIGFNKNKRDIHQMLSFASFSFVGNIGFVLRNQGVNIVVNIFFGTVINAARGIAYQVASQISAFASNFQMAAVPQITKCYASGDFDRMLTLIYKSSKYSFCLVFVFALPVAMNPDYLLKLWLGDVPEYAGFFLQLALLVSLIDCMAIPLGKGIDATGDIKTFQSGICIILCMDIPFAYLILKLGGTCYSVMYIAIGTSSCALFFRLILLVRKIENAGIGQYISKVIRPCLSVLILDIIIVYYIKPFFSTGFISYTLYLCTSLIITITSIYCICLELDEKTKLRNILKHKLCHI